MNMNIKLQGLHKLFTLSHDSEKEYQVYFLNSNYYLIYTSKWVITSSSSHGPLFSINTQRWGHNYRNCCYKRKGIQRMCSVCCRLFSHLFWMPLWSSLTPKKMAPTMRARKMLTPSCTDKRHLGNRGNHLDKCSSVFSHLMHHASGQGSAKNTNYTYNPALYFLSSCLYGN